MNLIPQRHKERYLYSDLVDLQREIDSLFGTSLWRHLPDRPRPYAETWAPALEVFETKDSWVVKAELPGIKKEDIDVSVKDGHLVLRGHKKEESSGDDRQLQRTERYYGEFERVLSLPASVDETRIKASYKDGVLELTLGKREEVKPKRIMIE
ncbi:MAG: Spore protein SP21 [Candidatus Omnitrophica bacterium]|nr:Spore protein SP21 [Candidatus Omnitrophota bacterium]